MRDEAVGVALCSYLGQFVCVEPNQTNKAGCLRELGWCVPRTTAGLGQLEGHGRMEGEKHKAAKSGL